MGWPGLGFLCGVCRRLVCPMAGHQRQLHQEVTAIPQAQAVGSNRATVELHQAPRQGKANAQATAGTLQRVSSWETFKNEWSGFATMPIPYPAPLRTPCRPALAPQFQYGHRGRCISPRVQQVVEDLGERMGSALIDRVQFRGQRPLGALSGSRAAGLRGILQHTRQLIFSVAIRSLPWLMRANPSGSIKRSWTELAVYDVRRPLESGASDA